MLDENRNIPQFVEDFTNYLIAIRNLSQAYITNLSNTIEQFLEFINVHAFKNRYKSIDNITLNDIRSLKNSDIYSFIFYLAECHYQPNSRVVKLEHIRTFFNYLFTIKHTIFREPFKKINSERKIEKKLPNYLSIDEGKKLINLYNNSDKPGDIRDKAIICIFLNCGLRLSELKDLNIEDIDLENNKFQIIGKGNKERTGYLNELTKDALLKYLKVRDNSNDDPKARKHPLFITKYSKRFNVKAIKMLIQKAYKLTGLDDKGYSVHTLKHTCATVLYKSGIDIRTIQKLLGHVQIDTTEIYTHLHDQKVMHVMLNHPLAKFKMADAIALAE